MEGLVQNRSKPKKAETLVKHLEKLIGRIYRYYIHDRKVSIDYHIWEESQKSSQGGIRPNDPMYLMRGASTPAPFDKEPMFEPFSLNPEQRVIVPINGKECEILIKFSLAREATLEEACKRGAEEGTRPNRGSQDYGKDAQKNSGISIVRARREIELDRKWCSEDTRDRWWGVEISFEPALDEIFGVTINKQYATALSDMVNYDWKSEANPGESKSAFLARLKEEEGWGDVLPKVHSIVVSGISEMRKKVKKQNDQTDGQGNPVSKNVNTRATQGIEIRKKQGKISPGDSEDPEQSLEKIAKSLEKSGLSEDEAKEKTSTIIKEHWRAHIEFAELDTPAFFAVQETGGVLLVTVGGE